MKQYYTTEEVLDMFGVPYRTAGENVGRGCIGTCCPFCGDTNYHCGVFLDFSNFTCWLCGAKGSLYRLIHEVTGVKYEKFMEVAKFLENDPTSNPKNFNKDGPIEVQCPHSYPITEDLLVEWPLVKQFMKERRMTLETLQDHRVRFVPYGTYAYRVAIPVLFQGKTISYLFRKIQDVGTKPKYLTTPGFPLKNYLYNYRSTRCYGERLVVVEGVVDAWRLSSMSAVALFGSEISKEQKNLIAKLLPHELIIALDSDAQKHANNAGRFFASFIDTVKVLTLPKGEDPDSLGEEKIKQLIKETESL